MQDRIMMRVGGRERPLSFDGSGTAPLLSSSATEWAGLPLEMHRLVSVETNAESGPRDGEHGVLVILEGRADITVRSKGGELTHTAVPGSATFMSGDDRPTVARIDGAAEAVAIALSPHHLSLWDAAPPARSWTRRLTPDATIRSLALAMCDEVRRGARSGRLFADSLSLAFFSYVSARLRPHELGGRRGLSEHECDTLRGYVQERLGDDLSLAELSSVVGLGPRHFSTLFRRAFRTSPHQYVMSRRLAEGARLLDRGHDITDVALRVGFSGQSHFTVAFRRAFGVTPLRYARGAGCRELEFDSRVARSR